MSRDEEIYFYSQNSLQLKSDNWIYTPFQNWLIKFKEKRVLIRGDEGVHSWISLVIKAMKSGPFYILEYEDDSIKLGYYHRGQIGCPLCFLEYHSSYCFNDVFDWSIIQKIFDAVQNKIRFNGLYKIWMLSSNGWRERSAFPHYQCRNCASYYVIREKKEEPLIFKGYQSLEREWNLNILKDILEFIPINSLSPFSKKEVYKIDQVFVTRIKITGEGKVNFGIGRSFDRRQSEIIALLESLERISLYSAFSNEDAFIKSSWKQIDKAIHPDQFFAIPLSKPFYENQKYQWMEGYSLRQGKVYVPVQFVYLESKNKSNEQRFYRATSNGTAIGGTIKEAIIFALMEYMERNNALRAWLNKDNLVRLPLDYFIHSKEISYFIDFFTSNQKAKLLILLTGRGVFITVWVHLTWGKYVLNSIGSGKSLEEAVLGALIELFTGYINFRELDQRQHQRYKVLQKKEVKVSTMEDHVLYYREAIEDFSFLSSIPMISPSHFFKSSLITWENLLQQLPGDVIVVDLTPSIFEVLDIPLYVVKVLIQNSYDYRVGDNSLKVHPFL
ncbi:YcaO-like family protein [Desmospora activa]|nr:YcaO-like family protein [Desmospora activa]